MTRKTILDSISIVIFESTLGRVSVSCLYLKILVNVGWFYRSYGLKIYKKLSVYKNLLIISFLKKKTCNLSKIQLLNVIFLDIFWNIVQNKSMSFLKSIIFGKFTITVIISIQWNMSVVSLFWVFLRNVL